MQDTIIISFEAASKRQKARLPRAAPAAAGIEQGKVLVGYLVACRRVVGGARGRLLVLERHDRSVWHRYMPRMPP